MSLLEDVFLEDEAGEAQDLERVIEGDEFDERPRTPDSNEASEKEDEAEEDRRVVDHTAKAKRVVKNPRFVLNPARLMGPRGIQVIPEHFKDFKFKDKGHEREDLDLILKKLEHWAYRLYPKFKFDDCLKKIETLGRKRPVMVHLHKIRTDQYLSEEIVQQQDSSGDEAAAAPPEEDEFDRLLQQQIELARSTPAPDSARKGMQTPMSHHRSPLMVPKVSSSPSINDEQKERMMRNRKLAEERRLARLNQSNKSAINTSTEVPETVELNTDREVKHTENTKIIEDNERVTNDVDNDINDRNEPIVRKHNRTNVINSDSSDDENDVVAVNQSVSVDVHNSVANNANISNEDTPGIIEEMNIETIAVDATVFNDDATEGIPVVKNKSKTNIIENDSSDEENGLKIIESVTVHSEATVLKEVDTEQSNSNHETVTEVMEADENVSIDSNRSGVNNEVNLDAETYNETSNRKMTSEENNDTVKEVTLSDAAKQNVNENHENIDPVSVSEDLMDVDFSDDF